MDFRAVPDLETQARHPRGEQVVAAKKQISLLPARTCLGCILRPALNSSSETLSSPKRVVENILSGNIELSREELNVIKDILSRHEVQGERYVDGPVKQHLHLWG